MEPLKPNPLIKQKVSFAVSIMYTFNLDVYPQIQELKKEIKEICIAYIDCRGKKGRRKTKQTELNQTKQNNKN